MSKRKQQRLLEEEAKWKRHAEIFGQPKPEVAPFSQREKEIFDELESKMKEVIISSRDPNVIRTILSLGYQTNPQSLRLLDLSRKIQHYITLEQNAAKETLWRKMYSIVYGFQSEVHMARQARERNDLGGSGVQ